ncbi:MAG TPA: cupredoxin domain-containing protein [Gaiellaceae bacterium]|nr:cupredoxin domain-containing protein [Gaiellaceae bacterium]
MKQRIALVVAVVAIGVGVIAAGAFARTQQSAANTITVTMTDFHFKIVKPAVLKHGVKYTVKEINKSTSTAHNIDFVGVKAGAIIAPGKTKIFTVTFKKKGKQNYVCDVPRHAELGMNGTLTIK